MATKRKVLIALDDDLAVRPVAVVGVAIGQLLAAETEALHVGRKPPPLALRICDDLKLPLSLRRGPVASALASEIEADDVVAVVVGTRSRPSGPRPGGRTTMRLVTSATKPIVVVPPDLPSSWALDRILLPINGSPSPAVKQIIKRAAELEVGALILHVLDEASIPFFEDQRQHENEAWSEEFLARNNDARRGSVQVRVGVPSAEIERFAESEHPDLVVLAWAQDLSRRKAAVVRASMERLRLPVMLVPLPRTRREVWPGPSSHVA
jgi:nucleotide-binding universal stress UspA family protein